MKTIYQAFEVIKVDSFYGSPAPTADSLEKAEALVKEAILEAISEIEKKHLKCAPLEELKLIVKDEL